MPRGHNMYIDHRPSFIAFEQLRIILLLLYTTHIFSPNVYVRFERTVVRHLMLPFPTCVSFAKRILRLRLSAAYCSCYILLTVLT